MSGGVGGLLDHHSLIVVLIMNGALSAVVHLLFFFHGPFVNKVRIHVRCMC